MLRRLAVRDTTRRPSETMLVIAGSLLGAALITGSFVVGDTLDASIRATAQTQLGPIDEIVTVPEVAAAEEVEQEIASIDDDRIDGVLSMVIVPASFSSEAGRTRAEPDGRLVETDYDAARSFGGDAQATGISGPTPGEGEVAITEDLAATLNAGKGDEVTAFLYGTERALEVSSILERLGVAGFWQGFESESANAFVAPGTIEDVTAGGIPEQAVAPSTTIAVSNRGDIEEGAGLTTPVTGLLEEAIGASSGLRVEALKEERLDNAQSQGEQFSQLFLNIGSFAILAGILLLINIFVMLSEERKNQLGMLRAVGMRRSDLIRLFVIEGSIYALVASVAGALLGIGVGWGIVKLAAPIFGGAGDFSLDLLFSLTPASVIGGFCIGMIISLATVASTSIRISRINIIRAIRDLPEPKLDRARIRTLVAGLALFALAGMWFVGSLGDKQAFLAAIVGPPLMAFGLLPLLSRFLGRRGVVVLVAVGSLAWGIFGNRVLDGQFFDAGDLVAFVFQGVLLTFSAVVLLTQAQENFEAAIRRIAASRLALRLGLAYPLARRFRTGLTLGMYALVVFTMTFIAVLSNVFGGQIDAATAKEAGGFDLLVTASESSPPKPNELEGVPGVAEVSTMVHGTALFQPESLDEPQPWPVTGVEGSFAEIGAPPLSDRAAEYESDEAVWEELVSNPRAAVVDVFFLQQGGGGPPVVPLEMGDQMTVIDPVTGAVVERTVIGATDSGLSFSGVFMARAAVEEIFEGRVAPNRFYVETSPGADTGPVVSRLQGDLVRNGVEADSFRSLVEESQKLNVQFLQLMQGYLALGLIVGIAGLGVVMIRAVRERRREIGVLRSLGFQSPQVRSAFVLESGFTAIEGILVGSILALVTAAQLVGNGDFGEGVEFIVPWANVILLCVAALAASLLATAWPARQASRIPPAVALRVAE